MRFLRRFDEPAAADFAARLRSSRGIKTPNPAFGNVAICEKDEAIFVMIKKSALGTREYVQLVIVYQQVRQTERWSPNSQMQEDKEVPIFASLYRQLGGSRLTDCLSVTALVLLSDWVKMQPEWPHRGERPNIFNAVHVSQP